MNHSRVVGIDYGTKRVGIAMSDPFRMFAQAVGTYSPDDAVVRLRALKRDPGFDTIVVGWPLTLSGEEGDATDFVRPFINRLYKEFPDTRLVRWDERYSSARARDVLLEAGVPKKKRREKGRVDSVAAAVILQEYLDEVEGE